MGKQHRFAGEIKRDAMAQVVDRRLPRRYEIATLRLHG